MTTGKLPPGWMDIDFGRAGPGPDHTGQHADHPARVRALMSARAGGVSLAPYDLCNLGDHVQDDPRAVARNRALFAGYLAHERGAEVRPVWMTQVHGNRVIRLTHGEAASPPSLAGAGVGLFDPAAASSQPVADGAITTEPGLACTVMVADCLPVLLAAPEGKGVAALHAGWRGLAGAGDMAGHGIVHAGVTALCDATGTDPGDLRAWLGPCIGPAHFEVGVDVLIGFGVDPWARFDSPRFVRLAGRGIDAPATAATLASPDAASAPSRAEPAGPAEAVKWLADLPGLARDTLHALGVQQLSGGGWCTVSEPSRFFSFRRDRVTGRQAASIWLCRQ